MDLALAAVIIAGLGFALTLLKDVFGGGSKLTSKFAALEKDAATKDKETTAAINALRFEFIEKNAAAASNSKIGFEAIQANIHTLQLGFAEFRSLMAENYMRRDSYYKATEELKRDFNEKHNELKSDVQRGFEATKEQIDHLAQSVEAGRKSARQPT